jgi:hypothetical protein
MSERDTYYSTGELLENRLPSHHLTEFRRRIPSEVDMAEIPVTETDGTTTLLKVPFTDQEIAQINIGQQALDHVLIFLEPTPDGQPYPLTFGLKRYPSGRRLIHRSYAIDDMLASTRTATDVLTVLQMFPQTDRVRQEVMPHLRDLMGVTRAVFQAGRPGGKI